MEPTNNDDVLTYHGEVPVHAGAILIVDPCHIPADVLRSLVTPNKSGVTVGVVVGTPGGDGGFPVLGDAGELVIGDGNDPTPWREFTEADTESLLSALASN